MTYPRARLMLGISCVGTLVVFAALGILFNVPDHLFRDTPSGVVSEILSLAIVSGLYMLILFPFDLYGGLLLPRIFSKEAPRWSQFLICLIRGACLHGALFMAFSVLYLRLGEFVGTAGVIFAFVLLQIVLIQSQSGLARMVGGPGVVSKDSEGMAGSSASFVSCDSDEGFTGGIAGLPGRETILVPSHWQRQLAEPLLNAAVTRREQAIRSGSRFRGLLLAVAWNTGSFSASLFLPGGGAASVANLVTSYLYFTLFSFAGLLLLPAFSRRAVFEVDEAAANLATPAVLTELVFAIDRLTTNEPSRSAALESVFHPVPCAERRAEVLTQETHRFRGAWHSARTALFLSWAFGGPLARSVHCNIGRPALWVFLPAD